MADKDGICRGRLTELMKKTNIIILAAASAAAAISLSGCVAAVGAGVAAGAVGLMATDSRTVGTVIDDSAIEAKAIDRLDKYSHAKFRESSLGTTSINGHLLIHGQTPYADYQSKFSELVSDIARVSKVYNEVEVREPLTLSEQSYDAYLTSKIKTRFLFTSGVSSRRFKVVTENKVVYLMGVLTKEEAKNGIAAIKQVDGIKKVITMFQYVSEKTKQEIDSGADISSAEGSSASSQGSGDVIIE